MKKIILFIMLLSVSFSLGFNNIKKSNFIEINDNNVQYVEIQESGILESIGKIFYAVIDFFVNIITGFSGDGDVDDDDDDDPVINDITISFSSYDNSSPTGGTTVNFSHTVKNASGKYQLTETYKEGKYFSEDDCIKITTNSYTEKDKLNASAGQSAYLKVGIYSDSSCKTKVSSKNSETIKWKGSTSNDLTSLVIKKIDEYNKDPLTVSLSKTKLNNSSCSSLNSSLKESDTSNANVISCIALAQVSRTGIDCYKLVRAVYQAAIGNGLTATASLEDAPSGLTKGECKKGSIIQYYNTSSGKHRHSAIYISSSSVINGGWNSDNKVVNISLSSTSSGIGGDVYSKCYN